MFMAALMASGQDMEEHISNVASRPVQSHEDVIYQLREYLMGRAPRLPRPISADAWTTQAKQIREHLLRDVIFHGWPKAWIESPPKFEEVGTIETGKGYRIRKLRYEIVPGFWSVALLYEPVDLHGKVPAILNVNGHIGPQGKAANWKQKRCINYALRGMIALNIEYMDMGELYRKQNDHGYLGHLDLVGTNGVGLFYLVMRRALDYLYLDPHVDQKRIGMTGLSGGGWQSIVLGSLDKRVNVAIPVAGFGAFANQLARTDDMGDNEQDATDFFDGQDYVTLTAMRAPRPTLLINNAEDNCCFRAPLVKPYIYDQVKPFFALYGAESAFQFYENIDPGHHNYGRDNREQSYRFFDTYFHHPESDREISIDSQIKTYRQLEVGLPADNLTILGLARKLAGNIHRGPIPDEANRTAWAAAQRANLKLVVRYKPVSMKYVWAVDNTSHLGLESISYRFEFNNGLSATGVWLKAKGSPGNSPVDIVLDDKGKRGAASEVWDRTPEVANLLDRGDQVILVNLLFFGDDSPADISSSPLPAYFACAVAAIGDRPLGLESAQLVAVAHWAQRTYNPGPVYLETTGIRTQMVALISAAIDPGLFAEINIHQGMKGLGHLLQAPVMYNDAPDMFCLDLYKYFDIDSLIAITKARVLENTMHGLSQITK